MKKSLKEIEYDFVNTILCPLYNLTPLSMFHDSIFQKSTDTPDLPRNFQYLRQTADELRYTMIYCNGILIAHYHPETHTLEMVNQAYPFLIYIAKIVQRLFTEYDSAVRVKMIEDARKCIYAVAHFERRLDVPKMSASKAIAQLLQVQINRKEG